MNLDFLYAVASKQRIVAANLISKRHSRNKTHIGLTHVGKFLACLMMLCALGFRMFHWRELLVSCLLCFACCMQAPLLLRRHRNMHATIVCPHAAVVGDTVEMSITVTNSSARSSPQLEAVLPLNDHNVILSIPGIDAYSETRVTVPFHAQTRAELEAGPLLIYQEDLLSLVWKKYPISNATHIFIHPVTMTVDSFRNKDSSILHEESTASAAVQDMEFHGLREYEPGDDLRHAHWISTAKTGRLMIRQYDASRQAEPLIVLFTSAASYGSAAEFETAISLYASYGLKSLLDHHPTHTICTDDIHQCRIWTNARTLLNTSSSLQPDFDAKITSHADHVQNLLQSGAYTSYIVIVGSNHTDAMLCGMTAYAPQSSNVLIIRVCENEESSIRRIAGGWLITVGSLLEFRQFNKEIP